MVFHFRLILLAGMGLGALYMLHLLALDFNKIRRPVAAIAKHILFAKRDLNAVLKDDESLKIENFDINWNRIIKNDPLSCAFSLICQIGAGAEHENTEAKNINALLQYSISVGAPPEIEKVYNLGIKNKQDFEKCYTIYPFCPYSAKTMLKILAVHSFLFSEETHTVNDPPPVKT